MTLEIKEINKSNSYCSNNNCHLPNPQILNRLHKESKLTWKQLAETYQVSERTIRRHAKQSAKEKQKFKQKTGPKEKVVGRVQELLLEFTAYRSKDNTLTQQEMADRV